MSEDAVTEMVGRDAVEPSPIKPEDLSVEMLVVLCGCSDGKLRVVQFEGKQAKQVHGYVRHIQDGTLKLKSEPLVLLLEREVVKASEPPPPIGTPPTALQRIRIFLRIERPVTSGLRRPIKND